MRVLLALLPILVSAELTLGPVRKGKGKAKDAKQAEEPPKILSRREMTKKAEKDALKEKRSKWKVATVESDWEEKGLTNVSIPDANANGTVIRPRFAIIPTDHEVGGSKTVEIFWQRPTKPVRGIFFGATGCFHQGGDFFEPIDPNDGWVFEGCKNSKMMRCQGLPENVYTFKYALERGYLVMTITPQDKNSCWNHEKDPARLDKAVKYVIQTEKLAKNTPMIATGASQGGYFMFDIQNANVTNLACIAPQCAEMKYHTGKEHLPTMMIWMPKDLNLTNPILETIDYLQRKKKVRLAVRTPHAWKFHELLKARGFSDDIIERVKKRLQHAKGPFGHRPVTRGGHIIDHPGTDSWWKQALRPIFSEEEDSFMKDHSKMHHLMQVAFAEHEFTSEYTDEFIDFCDGHDDISKPLRFNRPQTLIRPSAEAKLCSPNCPPPGSVDSGPLSNMGMYMADIGAKIKGTV